MCFLVVAANGKNCQKLTKITKFNNNNKNTITWTNNNNNNIRI